MPSPASGLSRLAVILAAAAVTTLVGCGTGIGAETGTGTETGAANTAGADRGNEEESFGAIAMQYPWIKDETFAGAYYAEDKGYYEEAGLAAVEAISGREPGVDDLLAGKVQVAIADAVSVGSAIAEQDAPLKIIGATYQKNPLAILSLEDGGDIAAPGDLRGKKIGVRETDIDLFEAMLAANGLEAQKDAITVVPVEADPTPLIKGQVDGLLGSLVEESVTVELAGHQVTDLPFADNGVPYVAQTYTVTDQYLAENRDALEALLTAEIKGWTETFENPAGEVGDVVTTHFEAAAGDSDGLEASYGELDPARTERALQVSQELISTPETQKNGLFTISEELQQQTVDSLAAAGWDVSAEDLFDTSIIEKVYEENPDLKAYRK